MLTKATQKNIDRVDVSIETSLKKCSCCGSPLPSWIEISPVDFCTRQCSFCPKGDDLIAPNQKNLFMPTELSLRIASDLSRIGFNGTIMLAGYGEPMAAPNIFEIIRSFSGNNCRVEITTNGDLLSVKKIGEMIDSGVSYIIVSMYDGPDQIIKFTKLFKEAGVSENMYTLRDRWYNSNEDYGVKLTNRAGLVNTGNQPPINESSQCFYPHYAMMVDWNGDVLLCTQDWHRRIKCGNLAFTSVHDVWTGPTYKKYRTTLFKGKRSLFPCSACNCSGLLHGRTHAEQWHNNAV